MFKSVLQIYINIQNYLHQTHTLHHDAHLTTPQLLCLQLGSGLLQAQLPPALRAAPRSLLMFAFVGRIAAAR